MAKNKNMTAGRLATFLKSLPKDMPIVLSQDSEGNGFGILTDIGMGGVAPVTEERYGVEVHSEEDAPKNAIKAFVIYPD